MSIQSSVPTAGVRCLLLDRPSVRNAVDLDMVAELATAIEAIPSAVAAPDPVRAVVLGSAAPGMFCAGADLTIPDAERAEVSDRLYALYGSLLVLPVPVIVAVDGAAVGGGAQLLLAADVRYGSAQACIRFAGLGHGLAVGLWALPSVVGRGHAMAVALGPDLIHAKDACSIGLLNGLVEDPLTTAIGLARHIATLDPLAVARAKRLVVDGERLVRRLADERAGNAAVFTGAVPGKAVRPLEKHSEI